MSCPLCLNLGFFIFLSDDEQTSCLELFQKAKKLTHAEIFTNIIDWCILPKKTPLKCHLFGIYIDEEKKIIGYYPPTFLEIVKEFLKPNQTLEGMQRFFRDQYVKGKPIINLENDSTFKQFLQDGFEIGINYQTLSKPSQWRFGSFDILGNPICFQHFFNPLPNNQNDIERQAITNQNDSQPSHYDLMVSSKCDKARQNIKNKKDRFEKNYNTTIPKITYNRYKKQAEITKQLKNENDLLKTENLRLKNELLSVSQKVLNISLEKVEVSSEKVEMTSEKGEMSSVKKKHSSKKDVDDFFQIFVPHPNTNLDNPDLGLNLLKNQMKNLTVSPTHREWDDKSKAVAWHEYFHNSVVGKGVYKAMPCEKTVKTFLNLKLSNIINHLQTLIH